MKSLRAKRVIRFIKMYFIVQAILGNSMILLSAGFSGILRVIISMIPLIAVLTLLDSICSGNKKDVEKLGLIIGLGLVYDIYIIFSRRPNIVVIIILIVVELIYISFLMYLIFSKDMKNLYKYYDKRKSLKWIWNWSGKCIGYEDDGYLWDSEGKIIGKFNETEVYSSNGEYIGEICTNGRIGISKSKKNKAIESFESNSLREPIEKLDDISDLVLYTNVEDYRYI